MPHHYKPVIASQLRYGFGEGGQEHLHMSHLLRTHTTSLLCVCSAAANQSPSRQVGASRGGHDLGYWTMMLVAWSGFVQCSGIFSERFVPKAVRAKASKKHRHSLASCSRIVGSVSSCGCCPNILLAICLQQF